MRKALAWVVLALVGFSILNWGEVQPYVSVKAEGWSPLARAIASAGLYEVVVPQAVGSSRNLRLFIAGETIPPDHLFYYSDPESEGLASDSVAQHVASDDPAYREQVAGSFTVVGKDWAAAWLGPLGRAVEARRALGSFGGPGSGMPSRSAESLRTELRATVAFGGGSISAERFVYLVLGVGKRLAVPGTVLLRVVAVLAPDGPFWVWVFEAAMVSGLVCLALALGGYPPFRWKRRVATGTRRRRTNL
jgi:hypothetical protein